MMWTKALFVFVAMLVSPSLARPRHHDVSAGEKPMMVGGYLDVDPSRKDVQQAAVFAVQELNKRANSFFADMLYTVVKAQTQVVAGIKYALTIQTVMSTECHNNQPEQAHTIDECAYDKNSLKTVHVYVVSQPWLPKKPMSLTFFTTGNDINQ